MHAAGRMMALQYVCALIHKNYEYVTVYGQGKLRL